MRTFDDDFITVIDYIEEKGIKGNTIYGRKATQEEVEKFLGYRISKLIDEGIISICDNCEFFVIDGETVVLQRERKENNDVDNKKCSEKINKLEIWYNGIRFFESESIGTSYNDLLYKYLKNSGRLHILQRELK